MKKLVFAALLLVAPVVADDLSREIKLLQTDLKADAKGAITRGMQTFTPEEAKRFWPVWDAYIAERNKFLDARIALLRQYADSYDSMTDELARDLTNRRFNQIRLRNQLDEKFRPQFATALSPRRLARFYQIQHELDLLLELQAVAAVPHVKWWKEE